MRTTVLLLSVLSLALARWLIGRAAYSYKKIIDTPEMTFRMQEFFDMHGTSAQRFYNMVCMAYGANPQLFADVMQNGFLPKERPPNCNWEYRLKPVA